MLGKHVEPLKNMSASASKFAKWYVRIIGPTVKEYTYQARGEKVNAKKFECVVVSRDPAQYMMGTVPFEFRKRQAADHTLLKIESVTQNETAVKFTFVT